MRKDSTSLACWGECLAMVSKVLVKAAMAVSGTPSLAAALRQISERVTRGGRTGLGWASVVGATTIWAAGAFGVGGLLAARRLAGAIVGGGLIEVDKIESSASRYRLLLLEERPPSWYSPGIPPRKGTSFYPSLDSVGMGCGAYKDQWLDME